jgi:hypothetical protein
VSFLLSYHSILVHISYLYPSSRHYPSSRTMAANMQDRGIAGFFSGSSLRISRKAASSAIAWTVYEAMLIFIRDRNEEITSRDSKPI